jgi:hypothetical protein
VGAIDEIGEGVLAASVIACAICLTDGLYDLSAKLKASLKTWLERLVWVKVRSRAEPMKVRSPRDCGSSAKARVVPILPGRR